MIKSEACYVTSQMKSLGFPTAQVPGSRSFRENGPRSPSFIVYMKEGERGPFFPKLRVRIKDNNTSLHGKSRRILFPFSSKSADQNFASYVLYIFPCSTRSEPGLPVPTVVRVFCPVVFKIIFSLAHVVYFTKAVDVKIQGTAANCVELLLQ